MNSICGPLLDEVLRRFVDDLLAEVAGAREHVDRAGVGDVLELLLADEGDRAAAALLGGVEDRRHLDVAALRLPRVPVQTVLLDVEAGQHRGVRRQRRGAPDRARVERVGGALHDRLVDGRADAHERIGAQAVLADDDDVPDRPRGRSAGSGGPPAPRPRRASGGPGPRRAAVSRPRGAGSRGPERGRAATLPTRRRRGEPTDRERLSDGLARFPICLNLPPSERFVRRRLLSRRVPLRAASALRSSRVSWLFSSPVSSASGCAHVEAAPCASDQDCKLNRLCDAGRCVWPADATHAGGAVSGQPGASLPLPQYAIEPAQAMFRFGPTHRGRSPFVLPAIKPTIWWTFATGGPIVSSPADRRRRVGAGRVARRQAVRRRARRHAQVVVRDGRHHLQLARRGTRRDDLHRLRRRPPLRGRTRRPRSRAGSCRWGPVRSGSGIGPEASRCDVDAGPDGRARRRHLHGRRRHLRHQPGRDPALAVRHRRPRLVGAGGARRRHGGGRQPGRYRSTPSRPTDRSAGTSAPAATSRPPRRSATTAPSTSAPTTTSSTRSAPTARCAGRSRPAATCAPRRPSATA